MNLESSDLHHIPAPPTELPSLSHRAGFPFTFPSRCLHVAACDSHACDAVCIPVRDPRPPTASLGSPSGSPLLSEKCPGEFSKRAAVLLLRNWAVSSFLVIQVLQHHISLFDVATGKLTVTFTGQSQQPRWPCCSSGVCTGFGCFLGLCLLILSIGFSSW